MRGRAAEGAGPHRVPSRSAGAWFLERTALSASRFAAMSMSIVMEVSDAMDDLKYTYLHIIAKWCTIRGWQSHWSAQRKVHCALGRWGNSEERFSKLIALPVRD
ncbi:MAG: hypothetical protein EBR09_17065 [Proteobacteria bacterium]|nr:hypothetical protein [Pseudomonadota bacterium]